MKTRFIEFINENLFTTIEKKYFMLDNQADKFLFCEIIRTTPKFIYWKHIGIIDKTGGPIPITLNKSSEGSHFELKTRKYDTFDILFQTDDYDKILKQYSKYRKVQIFKNTVNKFNL